MGRRTTARAYKPYKMRPADVAFEVFNYGTMIVLAATTLYPFLFILMSSISRLDLTATSGLSLIPRDVTMVNYARVLSYKSIWTGYMNTLFRTVLGTTLSLMATFALAYPLSKRSFPLRNLWTGLVVFTMFFSGGLIPTYLLVKDLGLFNTIWALVLPELVSAYNFIIVRNYMQAIPSSLEEAARMDGANDIVIFVRIILPICKPILATIALWVAVGHWNAWFDAMIYISNPAKEVLQLVTRGIVLQGTDAITEMMEQQLPGMAQVTPTGIKAATIMVTVLPILFVYPFLQKYFVKGVIMGSLKG